ncbi:MAG: peroxiredoxin [Pseudomonadota bacterium]|nr:peroxiredoxin [Pseudomonadota bacterium]|tara:strand:+ start:279 stop:743 length:465 start_codon:yes stop_codon:yes gene_type:complete
MAFEIGDTLPALTLKASGAQTVNLEDLKGTSLVLYFYPKDNTPGCTQEGQDFRDLYAQFKAAGAQVMGVSKDGVKAHDNFIAKHDFPFTLLSDADGALCAALDVMREKSMYGKTYVGIDRSTFLFNPQGQLIEVWRGVKVKGHAQAVLDALKRA